MSSSLAYDAQERAALHAALAPIPSPVARARSYVVREIAARLLPPAVLFAHGLRDSARKQVALTFDDGPDAMTERYLDLLERLGVRATFFVIGENAASRPELALEYARRGHEVGGHGYSHDPFPSMTPAQLCDELARTEAVLPSGAAFQRIVRPPRGALSARALLQIAAAGYASVLWSRDSDDCRTRDPRAVERRLGPGGVVSGDVVLLHEMQPWTLAALPGVVGRLRDAGYELTTVGELMRARPPLAPESEGRLRGALRRLARMDGASRGAVDAADARVGGGAP